MADSSRNGTGKMPSDARPPPWARDHPTSDTGRDPSSTDSTSPVNGPSTAPEPDSTVESTPDSHEPPASASASGSGSGSGAGPGSASASASTATASQVGTPAEHDLPASISYNTPPPPPPPPTWQPPHSAWSPTNPRLTLLSDLKRLSYVLSLVLGSSAIIGLLFSTFILPLLHSTFSARGVLMDQQRARWARLVQGLRVLRASPLLPPANARPGKKQAIDQVRTGEKDVAEGQELETTRATQDREHRSGIEEIPSSASSSASDTSKPRGGGRKAIDSKPHDGTAQLARAGHGQTTDSNSPATTHSHPHAHPLPVDNLASLSASLAALSSAISSTSTTRVSLLSTLDWYTSHLRREMYLRSDQMSGRGSSFSVGLGSLSQNLASAGARSAANGTGASGASGAPGTARTDWDDVRREVRAVKGLLLGRRNFVPVR